MQSDLLRKLLLCGISIGFGIVGSQISRTEKSIGSMICLNLKFPHTIAFVSVLQKSCVVILVKKHFSFGSLYQRRRVDNVLYNTIVQC